MASRRSVYLLALLGSLVFYWAYREWLSGFITLSLLVLPWFALLVSLPAILTTKASMDVPTAVRLGEEAPAWWQGSCRLPMPVLRGRLKVTHSVTGERWVLRSGDRLPADHCGVLTVSLRRPGACDYLGLFRLPIRRQPPLRVLVRPRPVPGREPDVTRCQATAWRPKPGGGFSENHELRLYRPGDNLHQVHWKLSAKTGKLIVREPMEAMRGQVLLTMELMGDPDLLDRKLGRLLWLSEYLLRMELPHEIRCLTGQGPVSCSVASPEDVQAAVDRLLTMPLASAEQKLEVGSCVWRCHVGGEELG